MATLIGHIDQSPLYCHRRQAARDKGEPIFKIVPGSGMVVGILAGSKGGGRMGSGFCSHPSLGMGFVRGMKNVFN